MADSEVKVLISGEAQGVTAAMHAAAASVREGVEQMKTSLESAKGAFESINLAAASLGALFAGGIFKEFVTATNELAENSIQLGIQLGITTTQASIYGVAIKEVGGTTDDFAGAARGMTRALKTNEKGLNEMGIATRDGAGHLLNFNTIMFNGIEAVNSYAAGTDRNLAAQTAFGRGATASGAIFRLQADQMEQAAQRAQSLGLIVGGDVVEAFEKNRRAMADVKLVGESLQVQVGTALIPVLLSLGQAFSGEGATAAKAFGQVIVWLGQAVLGLWTGLKELGTMLGGVAAAAAAIVHLNFGEARSIMSQLKVDLKAMSDEGDAAIAKLGETMKGAAGGGGGAGAPPGGDKSFNLKAKGQKGPDSRLQEYKNALEQMSQAKGDFDKKDIAADLQYWQSILANTTGKSKEDVKLRAEIEKEILALRKKAHDEDVKSQEENIKTIETLQLGEVEVKKQALVQQAALGKITNQEELQGEIQLENQKYAIEQKAINDKLKLAQFDQLARQKLQDQELVLEQKHTAAVQKLNDKLIQDEDKQYTDFFKSLQSGFQSTIAGFLSGTTSLGNTIKSFFMDIGNAIIGVIAQMAAEWAVMQLKTLIMGKVTATSQITANAGIAATAAMASVAAIPLYGWAMAPEVGAATFGDAMGYLATASAAGGFDIPGGINPVTQLHAQEMVLPAPLANAVRNMAGGGGGGGDVHIHAIDAHSFVKWSRQNNGAFGTAMKSVQSRFGLSS